MIKNINRKLEEIYKQEIVHETIHDGDSVRKCMSKSYELGKTESKEKYNKLKEAFLELLEDWADNGNYISERSEMENGWKKQGGLL